MNSNVSPEHGSDNGEGKNFEGREAQDDNIEHARSDGHDLTKCNSQLVENAATDPCALSKEHSAQSLHSAFKKEWKLFIVTMSALGAFISPLGTNIYFPALNTLAKYYSVSPSDINLSITVYMIFQAIAPTFFGDFGDQSGHRPAFILTLTIFFFANVGLALQSSYPALMVLRCMQSTGASGTIALRNGVIAEVYSPAERGTFLGAISGFTLLAPALAPVLGGLLTQYLGWRSTFWFLVIFSGVYLVPYLLLVPETNRKIVGNGSIAPQKWWNKSAVDFLRQNPELKATRSEKEGCHHEQHRMRLPNPWKTLVLCKEKDVSIILFFTSVIYAQFYAILTSIPVLYQRVYGLSDLKIGLCYIPIGAGAAIAAVLNGRLLDRNYRRIAKAQGFPLDKKKRQDLRHFPIEKARLQPVLPCVGLGMIAMIPYGWILEHGLNLAGPLVLTLVVGVLLIVGYSSMSNLLVDLFPEAPSTVTAANNLVRCLFGAAASALINPMLDALGAGWTFTTVALVGAAFSPLLLLEISRGPKWREARALRADEKRRPKAQVKP